MNDINIQMLKCFLSILWFSIIAVVASSQMPPGTKLLPGGINAQSPFELNSQTAMVEDGSVTGQPFEALLINNLKKSDAKSESSLHAFIITEFYTYPFLSDNVAPQNYNAANFKIAWTPRWHPSLTALFGKGSFYEEAFNLPHKAFISVSHVVFKKNTWYQLALSWDYPNDKYVLYLNGIIIGKENQFNAEKLVRDSIDTSVFTGNPSLVISTIKFCGDLLKEKDVYAEFKQSATSFSKVSEDELISTYNGQGKGVFSWRPHENWELKYALTFTKPSHIDSVYIQGNPVAVNITTAGLLMETIDKLYTGKLLDSQVYVWSNKPFEGDLYVEYEFKVLRPGGLSLLMVQASGMNREDFMADYRLRKGGRMTTVYGEDVRNYHWEYYREMADMRNGVSNSALMKNPFLQPLSFNALSTPVKKSVWHKLQFLQTGNKLLGAIDGIVMVEYTDNGFTNNGPVYDFCRIAIRCMLHSKMLFRNLKVYNKAKLKTEITIP
ncbi:MAG: DUF1961 family protein [Ferruginibacter sp.]|nr:DUF1961 family protein [Ferruginibacter sp.]